MGQPEKPSQRDRERTAGAILEAATELFLERGYAAVPLSLVAERAKVTKSLIHHYFGDKRGLWLAVKDAAVAAYAEKQRAVFAAQHAAASDGIADSVSSYFAFLQKHPEIARAFALESFEEEFEPSATERELQTKGVSFVDGLQQAGAVRADIEPDMVLAVFGALIEHWFISRNRVAKLNGSRPGSALDKRYLAAITKLLSAGLRPSSP